MIYSNLIEVMKYYMYPDFVITIFNEASVTILVHNQMLVFHTCAFVLWV